MERWGWGWGPSMSPTLEFSHPSMGEVFMRAWRVGEMESRRVWEWAPFFMSAFPHLSNIQIGNSSKDLERRAANCIQIQMCCVLEGPRDGEVER